MFEEDKSPIAKQENIDCDAKDAAPAKKFQEAVMGIAIRNLGWIPTDNEALEIGFTRPEDQVRDIRFREVDYLLPDGSARSEGAAILGFEVIEHLHHAIVDKAKARDWDDGT